MLRISFAVAAPISPLPNRAAWLSRRYPVEIRKASLAALQNVEGNFHIANLGKRKRGDKPSAFWLQVSGAMISSNRQRKHDAEDDGCAAGPRPELDVPRHATRAMAHGHTAYSGAPEVRKSRLGRYLALIHL